MVQCLVKCKLVRIWNKGSAALFEAVAQYLRIGLTKTAETSLPVQPVSERVNLKRNRPKQYYQLNVNILHDKEKLFYKNLQQICQFQNKVFFVTIVSMSKYQVIKMCGGYRGKTKEVEEWEAIFAIWSINSRKKMPHIRALQREGNVVTLRELYPQHSDRCQVTLQRQRNQIKFKQRIIPYA